MPDQTTTPTRTEADAVAEVVQAFFHPQSLTTADPRVGIDQPGPGTVPFVAVPKGVSLESTKRFLDEFRDRPDRRTGTATLQDLDSFIRHVIRFKDGDSAIFCDGEWQAPKRQMKTFDDAVDVFEADDHGWTMPSLTAVLDYHEAVENKPEDMAALPRFGKHRALYTFPLAEEFKAWTTFDTAVMSQANLARFLEDRALDIAPPPVFDGSDASADQGGGDFRALLQRMTELLQGRWGGPHDVMDMSRTMKVHEKSEAESTTRTTSGTGSLVFKTEHQDETGEVFKPVDLFLVSIPVFRNGPAYQLPVRLRYRLKGGRLWWFYELMRVDKAFEHALKEACDTAEADTGLPLFMGRPES